MARHWNTPKGLVVENSKVTRTTFGALTVIIAIVAVPRAHRTGKRFSILFEPGLTNILAGTGNAKIVALNASRANLISEAHSASRLALSTNSGKVIEVTRKRQTSLGLAESSANIL